MPLIRARSGGVVLDGLVVMRRPEESRVLAPERSDFPCPGDPPIFMDNRYYA